MRGFECVRGQVAAIRTASAPAPTVRGIHQALRAATDAPHQRLHRHPGFAALHTGVITICEYRSLLGRLLGFHIPFEAAIGLDRERSGLLTADLEALGVTASQRATLPLYPYLPRRVEPAQRMGARYVVEGSALGGLQLARSLDALLGREQMNGRRFFTGRGRATVAQWRVFLAQLEAIATDALAWDAIIDAAQETFCAFEEWMCDWNASFEARR